jgi:uncharacterized membrane protein YfcA
VDTNPPSTSTPVRPAWAGLTGLAGGAFAGLTGVGGGAIMVPMLTGLLGLGQHRAHATSLAIIGFLAIAGVVGYWQAGNIDWPLAATLTPAAVAGVLLGTRLMLRVPAMQLRLLFGLFLFFVAFRQLVWTFDAGEPPSGASGLALELAFGFAGGVLAGLLGVGGGAIFVPAIVIFGLAGDVSDPQKVAQGVSLVVIVFTAVAGTISNIREGAVDLDLLRWIAPVATIAALVAALAASRVDDGVLRRIYGITALLLGIQTVYTSIRGLQAGRRVVDMEAI